MSFHHLNWSNLYLWIDVSDLGLSDCIDYVSVGFRKVPVRCSSPHFQWEQSVSTSAQEHLATLPRIANHPGHPPATCFLHVSYKLRLFAPAVASCAWFSTPASQGWVLPVDPHTLELRRKRWYLGHLNPAALSSAVSQHVEVSLLSPREH